MYRPSGYLLLAVLGISATGLPLAATVANDVAKDVANDVAKDVANEGDVRSIEFVLPFKKALAIAKKEKRLIFLKPIYGGVDQLGAKEYRCGNW